MNFESADFDFSGYRRRIRKILEHLKLQDEDEFLIEEVEEKNGILFAVICSAGRRWKCYLNNNYSVQDIKMCELYKT